MIFVWGKKIVFKHLGFVADFCLICRSVQAFSVNREGLASHAYGISISEGELTGFQGNCQLCNSQLFLRAEDYATIATKRLELTQLVEQTFPNLQLIRAGYIERETALRENPMSFNEDQRLQLIQEPILIFSNKVEKFFSQLNIDLPTGLTFFSIFAWPLLLGYSIKPFEFSQDSRHILLTTCLVIWVALVARFAFISRKRFLEKEIFPNLTNALRPIHPTAEEIQTVLNGLRVKGFKIGKKVKAEDFKLLFSNKKPKLTLVN